MLQVIEMVLEIFLMVVEKIEVLVEDLMVVAEIEFLIMGGRGGDGGVDKLKLSLSSFGSGLCVNLSNLALRLGSRSGGLGAFLISSLAISFFPTSSSFRSDPTIGFSALNVKISSKTSSSGFCLLKIFLLIGSDFCLKLALLILSFVT